MNGSAIAKAHLMFSGMHIDIHICRLNLQKQDIGRVAAVVENILIGLAYSMGDYLVANTAAIDKKVLQVGLTSGKCWQSHPAPEANT